MRGTEQAPREPTDPSQSDPPQDAAAEALVRLKLGRFEDLARMREVAMNFVERCERRGSGLLMEREEQAFGSSNVCLDLARVTRIVRQTMVLEMEMTGERPIPAGRAAAAPAPAREAPAPAAEPAPPESRPEVREQRDFHDSDDLHDPDDYDDYDDYDHGPYEAVVAGIRATLGMEEPAPVSMPVAETVAAEAPVAVKPMIPASGLLERDGEAGSRSSYADFPRKCARGGHDPP